MRIEQIVTREDLRERMTWVLVRECEEEADQTGAIAPRYRVTDALRVLRAEVSRIGQSQMQSDSPRVMCAQELVCAANVQHNCQRYGCREYGEEAIITEGKRSRKTRKFVNHVGDNSCVLLNLFSSRNFSELRHFWPVRDGVDSARIASRAVACAAARLNSKKRLPVVRSPEVALVGARAVAAAKTRRSAREPVAKVLMPADTRASSARQPGIRLCPTVKILNAAVNGVQLVQVCSLKDEM